MRTLGHCALAMLVGLGIVGCRDAPDTPTDPAASQILESSAAHPTGPSHFSPGFAVGLELIAEGFTAPLELTEVPDGTGRLFLVDQAGLVRVILPDGTLLEEPFLDVRDRMVNLTPDFDERGLLGIAFHPDYESNGRFFVYYSAPLRPGGPSGWNHTSHVSEFQVSTDPNRADLGSEQILLQVDQPQFNHNAGGLHFGPDGMLYISLGDGGGANDTHMGHTPGLGNGQDATNLLGSILRVDVGLSGTYAVPADNPFVGTVARDEIFAYGLRNPYRFSFDMGGSRDLIAADVGQNLWEEVNVIESGGNYGWNIREATHCFDPENPNEVPEDCPDVGPLFGDPLIDPVIEYANLRVLPEGLGIAIIGGFVYRGDALPQLRGRYVFGDWSASRPDPDGRLFISTPRRRGLWPIREPRITTAPDGRLGHFLVGFGQDLAGEIYVLTTDEEGPVGTTGRIYRMIAPGGMP